MITQMLSCPHCALDFETREELHAHGHKAHRELTPKEHDQLNCAYCVSGFKERTVRDEHVAENRRQAVERLEEQKPAGS